LRRRDSDHAADEDSGRDRIRGRAHRSFLWDELVRRRARGRNRRKYGIMPCRNRLTNGSRLCANGELFWYDYFAFPTRTVYAIDARIRCASICRRCASTELDKSLRTLA